ncbi:MAG: isocitrate lyase/PEP mutase family protein [Proteobacteria bacterium]|nr:isocitrate lyase/PEP mutase family protein [Pseudomonadota bacterium]
MSDAKAKLREMLARRGMVAAPGSYDAISARAIAHAGFEAVYMTGAGTAASLGFPDFGLVTMTEMVANAQRIARSVDVPVIADADTGYGNELNVWRTVQEYERAGVAGIHIEDQEFPKKCGHLDNKQVIPREDYIAKIRAAADAKTSKDFLLIARTDSRAMMGLDEAVARANAALEAGADMAFVEAPQTLDEIAAVPRLVRGPCLLNMVWGGKTPLVSLPDAEAMGYKLSILPGLLLKEAIGAFDDILTRLKAEHRHPAPQADMKVAEIFRRFGADEWDERRTKFRDPAEAKPRAAAE